MPKPFHPLTLQQFAELLEKFPFTRQIDAVHMHHTWRPNHRQYKGLSTIEGMWRAHTGDNGWSDIAQHISIAPDGVIWTGRNWNQPPASAKGFNGNSVAGPFMFEIIGDFDLGKDPFEGTQKQTVLEVIARVQRRFDLPVTSLRFHSAMSSKTCPGSAVDYQQTLQEVRQVHTGLERQAPAPCDAAAANFPFPESARAIWRVIEELTAGSVPRAESAQAA